MKNKSVLISGASIAGLTMAYWMKLYGYYVTVVEIGWAPRMGGSPIDVRGDALDTAKRLGILDQIQLAKLQSMGLEFMNASGEVEGTALVDDIGIVRPGDDIQIRRDDLVNILYSIAQKDVNYKFNCQIIAMVQDEDKVTVAFKDGDLQSYDFVFGADGIHSKVRKLVFGDESQFKHFLNFYYAVFRVDPQLGKKNFGQMYNTPNTMSLLYYYNDNCADGYLNFRSEEKLNYGHRDINAQKEIVSDVFKNIGWKVPQMLDDMFLDDNFYFDQGCQIKMKTWTNKRVALIGDAGYAPAFPTGMGSSLAMQGATILADALAESANHNTAFKKYNEIFRDEVEKSQATVYDGISFLLPETQDAIDRRNKAAH